tara:strand:+ start:104 stop:505 length:402 start_codon:yes stop_codon:yes gene_type:complete
MESAYKQILVIQIILLPVLICLEIFFPVPEEISYLPYFEGVFSNISDGAVIFLVVTGIFLILLNWISCFLIYFYKSIGKSLYLWTLVLLVFAYLLFPHLSTGLIAMLDTLGSILAGATLVFIYYTPIKENFEK